MRALLRTVQAVLWGVAALAALRALGHLLDGFSEGWSRHGAALALHFMSTAVLAGAACWWQAMLMNKGRNPPVPVAVRQVETGGQIDAESLGTLGCERFPNFISETWRQEASARKKLLTVCAAMTLWCLLEACDHLKAGPGALVAWAAPLTGWLPNLGGLLLLWCSAALLGVLLVSNRDYRLISFDRVVRHMALALLGATAGLAVLRPEAVEAAKWLGCGFAALSWRWWADLRVLSAYRARHEVSTRIASRIGEALPFLPELPGRADCALPELDRQQIGRRISQGCRNVEEASLFVMRNLARFMRLLRVDTRHFVTGQLRYLTVRRYVTESCGTGTSRWLQDPCVPVWDEELFPIQPPEGYKNWLDPLRLWDCWDRVSTCHGCCGDGRVRCGTCGGSGSVTRRENDRDVTSTCSNCGGSGQVTCGTCSGYGRLQHSRTLNTEWQRLLPAVTEPPVPMPELMEDAEERVYFRQPLMEDRRPLDSLPEEDKIGEDLSRVCREAAAQLRASQQQHQQLVEHLHGGAVLYRSDFQITAHWTLRIAFEGLRGRVGWFFGKRPEFYFPALPFAWDTLAVVLILPPLLWSTLPSLLVWLERISTAWGR
ncbi:MAG: hypothetical protein JNG86_17940 [Verrucomicrobiaceae bacterium]|nr:hypothetical protein [Verrucomicrobiaceae bacterium]